MLKNNLIGVIITWCAMLPFIPILQYTFLASNKMYISIDYIDGASSLLCEYIKQDFKKSNICV